MPIVRVKICGITNPADAGMAVELGADALGFNFYERSARFLDGEPGWLREVPAFVNRWAVVVNAPSPAAASRWRGAGLVDAVQLHGDETAAFGQAVVAGGTPLVRALRVREESSLADAGRWGTCTLLLDACLPGTYGGTGVRLDWGLAARFVAAHPGFQVVLSGGLTPDNVAEAVRRVRPFAVDVASGVENPGEPRRKDRARVRDFIQAAKAASAAG